MGARVRGHDVLGNLLCPSASLFRAHLPREALRDCFWRAIRHSSEVKSRCLVAGASTEHRGDRQQEDPSAGTRGATATATGLGDDGLGALLVQQPIAVVVQAISTDLGQTGIDPPIVVVAVAFLFCEPVPVEVCEALVASPSQSSSMPLTTSSPAGEMSELASSQSPASSENPSRSSSVTDVPSSTAPSQSLSTPCLLYTSDAADE